MTIRPGQAWGEPFESHDPSDAPEVAADDAALARRLLDLVGIERGVMPQSGDVLRTLGLERPRDDGERWQYPVDLALATMTDAGGATIELPFVAHLSVRNKPLNGLGPGLSIMVLNAPWMGDLRLGPRAHLNDGRLDVVRGVVGVRQRFEATRRARSGDHLPHPMLETSRVATWAHRFAKPTTVWLDNVRYRRISEMDVRVLPDAGLVVA